MRGALETTWPPVVLTIRRYLLILACMRRKQGALIPIEESILAAAIALRMSGEEDFHGYRIAKEIKGQTNSRLLTGHGTLYRALGRLQELGLLTSRWEDPLVAEQERRPRRKLYSLSAVGVEAAEAAFSRLSHPGGSNAPLKKAWGAS